MADYAALDFNGQAFVIGAEGERYQQKNAYMVWIPDGLNAPNWFENEDEKANPGYSEIPMDEGQVNAFWRNNLRIVLPVCDSIDTALRVVALRYLSVKYGLISRRYLHNEHHCLYSETTGDADAFAGLTGDELDAKIDAIPDDFDPSDWMETFFDYVGILAYTFRARGHHYLDDEKFETSLNKLWRRCLHDDDELPCSWKEGFTYGLHAIYPDVLDRFWRRNVAGDRLAGTLGKRLDVSAAGSAIVSALYQGVQDIRVTIPELPADLEDTWEAFLVVYEDVRNHRWAYSINARLYGVPRRRIDESRFSVLASYVKAVYDSISDDAPLLGSKALERNARANPVTGYVMMRATADMVQKYSMALAYGDKLSSLRSLLEAARDV